MTPVPYVFRDHWKTLERACGYSDSAVTLEKTGNSSLTWDVDVRKAIKGIYPPGTVPPPSPA